jgi:hypothetical protein
MSDQHPFDPGPQADAADVEIASAESLEAALAALSENPTDEALRLAQLYMADNLDALIALGEALDQEFAPNPVGLAELREIAAEVRREAEG